ncbi:hypothetical protein [Aquabacterium sp. NJ1]|uniref:hypothetical protein n=1 Tax=Aquabacterium sp. NJ1 TaxID=1538295 RepID=UPI00350EF561
MASPGRHQAEIGVWPDQNGHGPMPVTSKAVTRADLRVDGSPSSHSIKPFSQALTCMQQLEQEEAKINVGGGALASPAMPHLLFVYQGSRYALATL